MAWKFSQWVMNNFRSDWANPITMDRFWFDGACVREREGRMRERERGTLRERERRDWGREIRKDRKRYAAAGIQESS